MSSRLQWLDVAKGGAILLVVLHHSILVSSDHDLTHDAFHSLDYYLKQMRMPLFFLASGITTSFVMSRSSRDYIATKLLPIAWIFLFWTIVLGVVLDGVFEAAPWDEGGLFHYLAEAIVHPKYGMWFVLVLGILSAVALLLRNVPPGIVFVGSLALTLANDLSLMPASFGPFAKFMVHNLFDYAFFYFIGLYSTQVIVSAVSSPKRTLVTLAVAVIAFVCLNMLVKFGSSHYFLMTQTARATAGAAIGLCLAVLISQWNAAGETLSWVGKRSLGIFVAHGLFLFPLARYLGERMEGVEHAGLITPPLITVAAVIGSLLLYLSLSRAGLTWLYILPSRVGHRIMSAVPSRQSDSTG